MTVSLPDTRAGSCRRTPVVLIAITFFAGSVLAADRHVLLDTNGNGQLNDCPNPAHNAKGTSNTDELFWCNGGTATKKIIGTVAGTTTASACASGGGTVSPLTNGAQVDLDRDGTNEFVYGHPQACVYYMAKSDSCEVHAGTYRAAGGQCNANCGDFSSGANNGNADFGICHDWNCWLASVVAFGFGPNLDGTGYGTAAAPGYLRGAVMNGSTDTWDTNGDKVADGAYRPILSGNRDGVAEGSSPQFDETFCSGAADCTGDTFRAVLVGCGGSFANGSGKILCSLNPTGSEEWVKIDSDANGTFDTPLNAVSGAPAHASGVGTRPVDHFIVKDIEFTGYNQGASTPNGAGRILEANINLNGDGAADGLKLDHIYLHDNAYGVPQSVSKETYMAHIADMQNGNCANFTEIKNSFLEQNNRFMFADEGSAHPTLGCSWRIHDNRFLINVKGYDANEPPAIAFFKSIDHHPLDLRPKSIRFYNNEVIYKQASNGPTGSNYGFVFGQFGTSPDTTNGGLGKGEFWMYGNIFRVHSSPGALLDRFFTPTCDIDCSGCSRSWRFYYFNNTWDAWSASTPVQLDGLFFARTDAVGELFVGRNNVEVFTTGEQSSLHAPNATTIRYGNNISHAATDATDNTLDLARRCGGTVTRLFACGSDPLAGSGIAYYTPAALGALIGTGSCDPDGDGNPGFDTDGDGDQDTTWTDIAGNTISCPTVLSPISMGAIQKAGTTPPTQPSTVEGLRRTDKH